jgi:hypothetical protein
MDKEKKQALINQFEELSCAFDDVLNLEENLICYKPFPEAWSIKENIMHCLDVDIANFHRYRWGITSPGKKVLSFDQTWTEKLHYQSSNIKLSLEIIKLIRKFMAEHLRSIVDENWNEYIYIFGEQKQLNLEEALKLYIDHVKFHRELIDRNINRYNR